MTNPSISPEGRERAEELVLQWARDRARIRRATGCGIRHLPDEGGVRWKDVLATDNADYHHAAEMVSAWADGEGREFLVLAGTRGTGKTQLAVLGLAKAVGRLGQGKMGADYEGLGAYYRVRSLLGTIKGTYSRGAQRSEMDMLTELAAKRYLVLDEYAASGLSETDEAILQELFDRRYEDCRRTLLITNVTRDALKDVLDNSTLSRIQETGLVLECIWPSFRCGGPDRRLKGEA